MESVDKSDISIEAPDKRVRMGMILEQIASGAPASSAPEACELVAKAFNQVENSFGVTAGDRMTSHELQRFATTEYHGRTVYFFIFSKHTLFIGQNGAIDIRRKDEKLPTSYRAIERDSSFPQNNMALMFEKPGSDGRLIWN